MYLSTLFLSELENGAERALAKCNEEYVKRLISVQDHISSFLDTADDEIMALWDVCKDFEGEIVFDLPVTRAMRTVCTRREQKI